MNIRIGSIFTGATLLVLTSSAWADGAEVSCEISASGAFDSGPEIDGSGQSIVAGAQSIDWSHDDEAAGLSFDTIEADSFICELNGALVGLFSSETGTGSVNGSPGYGYEIRIVDNRPAPAIQALSASITHRPTRRNDGALSFSEPRPLEIPAEISVITGGSGTGKVNLTLDGVICTYVGVGAAYAFNRCSDDTGYAAGDIIIVSELGLRIKKADKSFPLTAVEVVISTEPAPGAPDEYSIRVFNSVGTDVINFEGDLVNGDIAITVLPDP